MNAGPFLVATKSLVFVSNARRNFRVFLIGCGTASNFAAWPVGEPFKQPPVKLTGFGFACARPEPVGFGKETLAGEVMGPFKSPSRVSAV